jgi:hypothetical protein
MKTDEQRIARYNARMQSQLVGPAMGSQLATMVTNYENHVNEFQPKQQACAEILDREDVVVALRFGYHAFNNEVYHAVETLTEAALQTEVCALYAKYVSLGLTPATLDMVIIEVWTLNACTPPA